MSDLVVAGIGNRYRADDGIGLWLAEALDPPPGVRPELWEDADALTLANLLLELSSPVLLVDCADMGLAGGEWRCFRVRTAGDCVPCAELVLRSPTLSCHGLGLAEAMRIAMELGCGWPVHVFGVQPCRLKLLPRPDGELSPAMRSHLPALHLALRQCVRALCTTCKEEV